MNRRTSLPGIDELFGTSGPEGAASPPERGTYERPRHEDPEVAEARATVQQLTADEGAALRAAREAAADLDDVPSPAVGALLRWAVTISQARTVIEVGSAGGISGLWLTDALPDGGVLTSLEPDPERQQLAAKAFAGIAPRSRVRAIQGEPATLLERLADASYDLVLLQDDRASYPEHLAAARRLLRPGGMLVARGCLPTGEHREPLTRFLHDLVEDPGLQATVLPGEEGIAVATRVREPNDAG